MKEKKTPKVDKKGELLAYLKVKTPTLFDRDPTLTGNLEAFADEIIKIIK